MTRKILYIFSTDTIFFFANIFFPGLVECIDAIPQTGGLTALIRSMLSNIVDT
jgi:hypothetical protein